MLAEMLRTEGACVKEVQIGEIRMLDVEEEIFAENFVENRPDWIIFTGKNGVKGFFRQLYHAHMDARNPLRVPDCRDGKENRRNIEIIWNPCGLDAAESRQHCIL